MTVLLQTILYIIFFPASVMALPAGGKVAGGSAGISQPNGQTLNVNQSSNRAIINWKGFSISANELVKFSQPNSNAVILNRVTGVDPSSILGRLIANGRVFIVNPNGVFFGPNSVVDVAGLVATTFNIKDSDFMAGKYTFSQDPSKSPSYVINKGEIKISDDGFAFLVAAGVGNDGLIIANLGKVVMGSGQKLTLDFMGDRLINFAIEGKVLNRVTGPDGVPLSSAVANSGIINADGGQVILSARASSEVFSSVVNNSGVIEAKSLVNRGGIIRLESSDPVANTGAIGWQENLGKVQNADGGVLNTGTLDVSAAQPGTTVGEVTLSGQTVGSSGTILARGAEGSQGGRVLMTSTDKTVVTSNGVIDTSGVGKSNAGNVVVWSDKDTVFRGHVLAEGGKSAGDGGRVEVSGHENLLFAGAVNTLAPNGVIGSLLLDPRNITVATAGAATLPQVDQFSDTPGTDQTIAPATINSAAANVTLQANNDITISNAIAMTTPGVSLTMQAGRDININGNVGTTNGAISLTANDSAATSANRSAGAGDIAMAVGTIVSSGSGNMTFTVGPSSTAPFSPGNIAAQTLTTNGGSIVLNGQNAVTLNGAVNAGSGSVTIGANKDGGGSQGFTMAAGSSITTSNTTPSAVAINVNAVGGGTGAVALRNITTGSGGTLTVATNTGGNSTGGDITQAAGTRLHVGAGTIDLATPAITGANIGSSGANLLTTAGTITANTGTSGVFITESDGASFTATASGGGAINLTSTTGPLTIAGATSSGSGAITLVADTVNINAPLASTGALTLRPVTASGDLTVSSSVASNLTDGFSGITIGDGAGTGAVAVNALTVNDPLTIRAPSTTGTVTVNGPITVGGNGSVTLTGGTGVTPIVLNAGITTAGRAITVNDNVGLGANVVLDSTNGGGAPAGAAISVTGTVNADSAANNRTLTLAGGTGGNVTLSGAVGGTQPLQNLTVANANQANLPAITTRDGGVGVTASTIRLNGNISTDSVGTAGPVTLTGPVVLGGNVVIDTDAAADANINFSSTINGARALTLSAGSGNVLAQGAVGGTAPLTSLTAAGENISLLSVVASGDIALTSVGDLTINSLTSTAGGIDLTATAGSILDGNGAANNLTAAADSTLRALGGVVGLSADPIEVSINPGTLGVAATGQIAGVSVNIDGAVLPSSTLILLNSPPGQVIFNGRILNPSPPLISFNQLVQASSDLNPQRVNESNYFTSILLNVLDDDFFLAEPDYCRVDDAEGGSQQCSDLLDD